MSSSTTLLFSSTSFTAIQQAGAIYCRNWTMQRRPRDGSMLWQISQRGRHCWDGSVAWFGTYRGVAGYHECGYDDYGIFSVRGSFCTRSGTITTQIRNSYAVTFQIPRRRSTPPSRSATRVGAPAPTPRPVSEES